MGSAGTEKIPLDGVTEGSETTIEIKIKTLDSQTYTLRVDKQMPVPALKEQITSVTGVLSERQRLICRGKVLKDDQLLSAYHVEDGHTLHLVARQPDLSSPGSLPNHSATEPNSSTSHIHSTQVAPGVFIETFSLPAQGNGVSPEINRIVSAVLGSIGLSNFISGNEEIDVREQDWQGLRRTSGSSGIPDSSHPQVEQAGMGNSSDRLHYNFGLPTAVPLGPLQPPVIPDSLTTLSLYLSHIRQEFDAIIREEGNDVQPTESQRNEEIGSFSSPRPGSIPEVLSSPASLSEVLLSTRQMFTEQAGECLLQLARQLENQQDVTDPLLRSSAQSRAWRTGVLLYNLGAFLLELGRTSMTLHLSQTPSEAVVNGGPAVFISPSGPNNIMVQPLLFQSGGSFGAIPTGAAQSGSGLGSGLGSSFFPRHIDINIRQGSSTTMPNVDQEERGDTIYASAERNTSVSQAASRLAEDPSFAGESGVRIVPIRTMVAAVPGSLGRSPSESSGNPIGLYHPLLRRFQHRSSGHGNSELGSQSSRQHQQAIPLSTVQGQSNEDPARNGSLPTPSTRQEPSATRSVNINILAAGGAPVNQDSERQIPDSVVQFMRALIISSVVDSSQREAIAVTSEDAGTSRDVARVPEAEARVNDEGMFLSNLLRGIMPLISQQAGSEIHVAPETEGEENSSGVQRGQDSSTQVATDTGTSGTQSQSDSEASPPPSPKRQKMNDI